MRFSVETPQKTVPLQQTPRESTRARAALPLFQMRKRHDIRTLRPLYGGAVAQERRMERRGPPFQLCYDEPFKAHLSLLWAQI